MVDVVFVNNKQLPLWIATYIFGLTCQIKDKEGKV